MKEHPYKVYAVVPDEPSFIRFPIDIDKMIAANERHLVYISERNKKHIPEELYNKIKFLDI